MSDWTPVIGLEVHAEMLTESKMFSSAPVVDSVQAAPNTAVDPLSLGMPGTLPVINEKAMEWGLKVGLALNCQIPQYNQFARKSYFYPDLPKGYQISQYEYPLAINGYVDIVFEDANGETREKRIGVTRAHMEEDTGKSTHTGGGASLIDLNRAGVPLLEIVSEPDLRSSAEAEAYARKLRAILRYLGVNHGDMSKGVLRFEANVSVMHKDDTEYRQRTEIKNLNSIRSMVRAIDVEVKRQIKLYEKGDTIKPATLGWNENSGKITIQRYKERADEYRYFPEPDLPWVEMTAEYVDSVRTNLPELPDAKQTRFMDELGLSEYDASVLVSEKAVADYYEAVISAGADPKSAANWMLGGVAALLNKHGVDRESLAEIPVKPGQLAALVKLASGDTLNKAGAEKALAIMWETGDDPATIVEREGLAQVSDTSAIEAAVQAVLDRNAGMVERYKAGEQKLFGALMGQSMGALKGKGNPAIVKETLQKLLKD